MFVSQIFDECAEILGTTNSEKIFRKISQAIQTLMESGHWTHSTAEVDICTGWDGMSLTLPRGVDVPLAVNTDGSPLYFRNRLFQYHVNKGGMFSPVTWAWDDRGYTATMMQIIQPAQLVAIAEAENDVGKIIRVIGTDSRNNPLRSQLENGIGVDGILIPIHSTNDYPYGVILPDNQTVETRKVAISPITKFLTITPHTLSSGESIIVKPSSGTIPPPLLNGQTYYIGVVNPTTIQFFNDQNNAQQGIYPILLQSIIGTTDIEIRNSRTSQVVTALNLGGTPAIPIDTGNPISFPALQTLPTPLVNQVTYFANLIDATHLQIFETLKDAQNNTNPVYLTGSSANRLVDVRKPINPESIFRFASPHYFTQGSSVQATTSGGALPAPLIENQQYFVNIVDDFSVSLHTTKSDAIASNTTNFVNPIEVIDSGTGTNSLFKLIPSTILSGETNQVISDLNLVAPSGSGASFQAVVVGSVRSVNITNTGNGYVATPNVIFSEPPEAPVGSGQLTQVAQGYAIINVTTTKIEQIIVTDPGFGYIVAPTITIDAPTGPSPTQAAATAQIQTSSVSYFTRVSGGGGYTQPPIVDITGGGGSGATAQAVIDNSVYTINNISRGGTGGTVATVTLNSIHNFDAGTLVTISGSSAPQFNGQQTVVSVPTVSSPINSITRTGSTAFVTQNGHGYFTGQRVTITGASPAAYNGQYTITVTGANTYTYVVSGNPLTPATTPGTASVPDPNRLIFTFTTANSGALSSTGGSVVSGQVTALNIITNGTGYSSPPVVVISPSTGVFVEFSSTGNLPAPLVAGVAYRAETPLGAGRFSIRNADFSRVNVTGNGSGTIYTVLSRSFSIQFTNKWIGDFENLSTGQQIYFGTDFILPTTTPAIDNGGTAFYLNKVTNKTAKVYTNQPDAIAGGITGLVNVSAFGFGQSYYALRYAFTPEPYDNLIKPSNTLFLSDDEIVQFSTSNTLPSPLLANTDYKIKLFGDNIKVYDLSGTLINLTSMGSGQLSLDIIREAVPVQSTSIIAENSLFETGQAITVRPQIGDTLPDGLLTNVTYYVRRLSNSEFELYSTQAAAKNTSSTANRISYTTPGSSVDSQFFIDAIDDTILVKTISQIEKPITDGFVSLYAWDYGRSNDMTLIGQYHPSEVNPQYRRIRLGKCCAWARIAYRVTPPFITSKYDYVPIEHERAIIAAIHAVDMEDKDFAEQSARYWGIAFNYLKNQQEYIDGHAMSPPQINNITYGDGTDVFLS